MPLQEKTRQSPDFRITVALQMADYRKRVAEQIKAGMARKSISREELAHEAGVTDKTIKRLLDQKIAQPRRGTIRGLADALDREPEDLWPAPEVEADQLNRIEKQLELLADGQAELTKALAALLEPPDHRQKPGAGGR